MDIHNKLITHFDNNFTKDDIFVVASPVMDMILGNNSVVLPVSASKKRVPGTIKSIASRTSSKEQSYWHPFVDSSVFIFDNGNPDAYINQLKGFRFYNTDDIYTRIVNTIAAHLTNPEVFSQIVDFCGKDKKIAITNSFDGDEYEESYKKHNKIIELETSKVVIDWVVDIDGEMFRMSEYTIPIWYDEYMRIAKINPDINIIKSSITGEEDVCGDSNRPWMAFSRLFSRPNIKNTTAYTDTQFGTEVGFIEESKMLVAYKDITQHKSGRCSLYALSDDGEEISEFIFGDSFSKSTSDKTKEYSSLLHTKIRRSDGNIILPPTITIFSVKKVNSGTCSIDNCATISGSDVLNRLDDFIARCVYTDSNGEEHVVGWQKIAELLTRKTAGKEITRMYKEVEKVYMNYIMYGINNFESILKKAIDIHSKEAYTIRSSLGKAKTVYNAGTRWYDYGMVITALYNFVYNKNN